jgi:hypothetical protein
MGHFMIITMVMPCTYFWNFVVPQLEIMILFSHPPYVFLLPICRLRYTLLGLFLHLQSKLLQVLVISLILLDR